MSPAAEITTPCISDGVVVFAFICFPLGWVVTASMLSFSLAGNPKPVGGSPRNRTEPSDPQSIAPKLYPAASHYKQPFSKKEEARDYKEVFQDGVLPYM